MDPSSILSLACQPQPPLIKIVNRSSCQASPLRGSLRNSSQSRTREHQQVSLILRLLASSATRFLPSSSDSWPPCFCSLPTYQASSFYMQRISRPGTSQSRCSETVFMPSVPAILFAELEFNIPRELTRLPSRCLARFLTPSGRKVCAQVHVSPFSHRSRLKLGQRENPPSPPA